MKQMISSNKHTLVFRNILLMVLFLGYLSHPINAQLPKKKIAKNEFGFDDFLSQIQQIKKMGSMKDLIGMIPGAGKAMKDVEIEDDAFKHIEAIIHSMTPKERQKPAIIDVKRKTRIAKGSGTKIEQVNQLLKQFEQMSKMMKMMQGGGGKNLMRMMGGMKGMN